MARLAFATLALLAACGQALLQPHRQRMSLLQDHQAANATRAGRGAQPAGVTAHFLSECGMFCLEGDRRYAELALVQLQGSCAGAQYAPSVVVNGTCASAGYDDAPMVEPCYPDGLYLWFRGGAQGASDRQHFGEPDGLACAAYFLSHTPAEIAALNNACPRGSPNGWDPSWSSL